MQFDSKKIFPKWPWLNYTNFKKVNFYNYTLAAKTLSLAAVISTIFHNFPELQMFMSVRHYVFSLVISSDIYNSASRPEVMK